MNKKENNIVYVFVDTQNLNKSFKKLGFDLDYTEFIFFEYEKARKIVEFVIGCLNFRIPITVKK